MFLAQNFGDFKNLIEEFKIKNIYQTMSQAPHPFHQELWGDVFLVTQQVIVLQSAISFYFLKIDGIKRWIEDLVLIFWKTFDSWTCSD